MATRTISQRIALEGGSDFRNQLKSLGEAGKQAFATVTTAVNNASTIATRMAPVIDTVQKKINDLRNSANRVHNSFQNVGNSFRTVGLRLALLSGTILGVQGGFAAMLVSVARTTEEIVKNAAAAGLTTEVYQSLAQVFDAAGLSGQQMADLFNRMNKSFDAQKKEALELQKAQLDLTNEMFSGKVNAGDYVNKLVELQQQSVKNTNAFERLGISASLALNNPREALLQAIDAFARLPDGIEKSALQMEIFGRNGTKLAAIANGGRKAFIEMEKDLARVSPPLTKIQLQIGNKLDDAFDKVKLAITSTRNQFFLLFGPSTTALLDSVTEAIVRNRGPILEFGAAVLKAFDPIIQRVVQFIDAFTLDPASFNEVTTSITNFVRDIGQAITIAVAAWEGFIAVMQLVADGINAIFGTDLSGRALAFVAILGVLTGAFSAVFAVVGAVVSVIGFLATAFGGINLIIAAVGVTLGFVFGQNLIDIFNNAIALIEAGHQALIEGWDGTVQNFQNLWDDTINIISDKWTGFKDLVLSGISAIIDGARRVASAFGFGGGENGQGFSGGGHVRGAGTATSDSIRAWLSDGEFVVRTKAVKHYGVNFMNALNNLKIPSPQFALGGLVNSMVDVMPRQRFAVGGLVTTPSGPTGRPVILKIGDQTFGPMSAPDDVVNRLERFASGKQVRSAGRKPAWVG